MLVSRHVFIDIFQMILKAAADHLIASMKVSSVMTIRHDKCKGHQTHYLRRKRLIE